jgi:alkaline phosphatase
MRTIYFFLLLIGASLPLKSHFSSYPSGQQNPKNVILIIGSGLGLTHLSAISYHTGQPMALEQFSATGLQTPHTFNDLVADPIACTAAIANGEKTMQGELGLQESSRRNSILTLAKKAGYTTGMVTTSGFDHPVPLCFLGTAEEPIALQPSQLLVVSDLDLFIGGGSRTFDASMDRTALDVKEFHISDYNEKPKPGSNKKSILFTGPDTPPSAMDGRKYLPDATQYAATYLSQKNETGFFLVILSTQINDAALAGDEGQVMAELQDYNQMVKEALGFANRNKETLIVATSDIESGGLAINPGSAPDSLRLFFNNNSHTGTFIPVFATGPGAERFSGIYDNTDIFFKIKAALGL